jgi:hypothetical protein
VEGHDMPIKRARGSTHEPHYNPEACRDDVTTLGSKALADRRMADQKAAAKADAANVNGPRLIDSRTGLMRQHDVKKGALNNSIRDALFMDDGLLIPLVVKALETVCSGVCGSPRHHAEDLAAYPDQV